MEPLHNPVLPRERQGLARLVLSHHGSALALELSHDLAAQAERDAGWIARNLGCSALVLRRLARKAAR